MTSPLPLQARHVSGATLVADRYDLIRDLTKFSPKAVAEVGVAFGDFSQFLIDTFRPTNFHAFDLFELHKVEMIWGKPSSEVFCGKSHRGFYQERLAHNSVETRIEIFEGDSSSNMLARREQFYDVIYIDGDHEFEGVKRDTAAAISKLKNDGFLIFNDYVLFDHLGMTPYGIVPVVNDLCVNHGWRVTHFAFQQDMFCDIALRREP